MRLHDQYPDVSSIRRLCNKKVPKFVFDYFDSATGSEIVPQKNIDALKSISLTTRVLQGDIQTSIDHYLDTERYMFPIGCAPVGMSGLMHPNAEIILAKNAVKNSFPYVLSTVAACSIERLVSSLDATTEQIKRNIWFQLYCPHDENILSDLLFRAHAAGIEKLVVTIDLPAASVRERQIKSGLTIPPSLNTRIISDCVMRPAWSLARISSGWPKLENLEKYNKSQSSASSTNHIGYQMRTNPDFSYIQKVRKLWKGKLRIKGISSPMQWDAVKKLDVDCLWISNHAGRQFDAHISSIDALVGIRQLTNVPLIFDSGIASALDAVKAYAVGADFVMAGKAWLFAVGAFGNCGASFLTGIWEREFHSVLQQLGLATIRSVQSSDIVRMRDAP